MTVDPAGKAFLNFLEAHRASQTSTEHRKTLDLILQELEPLTKEVVLGLPGAPPQDQVKVRLFHDGSSSIGICSPDADLDLVCVVPAFVSRHAFVESFISKLQKNANYNKDSINYIITTRIPNLQFKFREVAVDLSLAIVKDVSEADLSPAVTEEEDPREYKATLGGINAVMSTEALRQLMGTVTDKFCQLFRFVRLWAKSRLIYGSSFGFLNGIACQLFSAFVLCEHWEAPAHELVRHFFELCTDIKWDEQRVCIDLPDVAIEDRWEKNEAILLIPVRQPVNTLKLVTKETLAVLKSEFAIGMRKVRNQNQSWKSFLEPPPLLKGCKQYIRVQFWTKNERVEEFEKWKEFIVSQVPRMVNKLKEVGGDCQPTPLPFAFTTTPEKGKSHCGSIIIGLKTLNPTVKLNELKDKTEPVFAWKQPDRESSATKIGSNGLKDFMKSNQKQLPH
jgi:poly(A) polymerase Pap1